MTTLFQAATDTRMEPLDTKNKQYKHFHGSEGDRHGPLLIPINLSWRRDEILARGKNRGKRIGENKGVRRFSLFYSSPGAGFAPGDVRRKINI
jgi:hypothetical protein